MSRCIGCGAIIQSNNPEQLGYVAEAILLNGEKMFIVNDAMKLGIIIFNMKWIIIYIIIMKK